MEPINELRRVEFFASLRFQSELFLSGQLTFESISKDVWTDVWEIFCSFFQIFDFQLFLSTSFYMSENNTSSTNQLSRNSNYCMYYENLKQNYWKLAYYLIKPIETSFMLNFNTFTLRWKFILVVKVMRNP